MVVDSVELIREVADAHEYVEEMLAVSVPFAEVYECLGAAARSDVERAMENLAQPYVTTDGSLRLPGRSLVACAGA